MTSFKKILISSILVIIAIFYFKSEAFAISFYCHRDNPNICTGYSPYDNLGVQPAYYPNGCVAADACAPTAQPGNSCTSSYSSSPYSQYARLSYGESYNGSFMGCSGSLNCFCPQNVNMYNNFTYGNVSCLYDNNQDSCAARIAPVNPINGSCNSTHYNCNPGTLGSYNEESTYYWWWCNGSDGGSNAYCTENKPTPTNSPTTPPFSCPAADAWCSNHGGIALTVPQDVANWTECRNWCDTVMNQTNYPLCQYNGGGNNRNCWVNYAPSGGISACNWTANTGVPPYGAVSSEYNCPRSSSAINGSCNSLHYNCNAGTSANNVSGATTWTWNCNGSNGGSNASCTENKPQNGSCNATHYNCNLGTSVNNSNNSTTWTWGCNGYFGGTDASCTENKVIPAWWQVKDGDVTANGDIISRVFQSTFKFNTDGSGGFPGIPVYTGVLTVSPGTISSKLWNANTATEEMRVFNYSYFDNLIPDDVISGQLYSDGYRWEMITGHYTLPTTNFGATKNILFVNGNLTIDGNINLDDDVGFFLVIVKGTITINPTVTQIKGIYETDAGFNTGLGTTQLHVRGSVVSYGGISLQRNLTDNSTQPAELFEFAPDQIALFPNKLGFRAKKQTEVAP